MDLDECRGCNLCQPVCPFEAISIEDRTDGLPFDTQVRISEEFCEGCGFCVTACPYSSIVMRGMTNDTILERIDSLLMGDGGKKPVAMAYVCERSVNLSTTLNDARTKFAGSEDVAVMVVPCIGVISLRLMEETFKAGAKGLMIIGCRALDCHYRQGADRVEELVKPESMIGLEDKVERVKIFLVSRFEDEKLVEDVNEFVDELKKNNF